MNSLPGEVKGTPYLKVNAQILAFSKPTLLTMSLAGLGLVVAAAAAILVVCDSVNQ